MIAEQIGEKLFEQQETDQEDKDHPADFLAGIAGFDPFELAGVAELDTDVVADGFADRCVARGGETTRVNLTGE